MLQGGFAKCYELEDTSTGEILAGKIVPKSLLVKQHQRDKMAQEITLHKALSHAFVVKLHGYFEDSDFVYIVLELCRRRSLMELHKRRKAVTEPEARYFMNQILLGVKYLHENKIIHRDLKLGNIFLNDNMEVCFFLNSLSVLKFHALIRSNLETLDWRQGSIMTVSEKGPCAEHQTTSRPRSWERRATATK